MADITTGTVLGPYRVIELIGSGGMARVYRAHHASLERDVAIKVLPSQYAADAAFLERFQQEARTVARLRHPNILEVFDFGEHDGQPYIVMEYMAGGTLAPRLGNPMTLTEAIPIIDDVAAGLDYAHDHGVLHRDIKPGNVFFDLESNAVVGDFGLAKIMEAAKSLTTAGTTLGTPEFMSPEQALGRTVDRRTDVYSLGAVIYMMLTGSVPYSGDTPLSTMFAHVQQPLPPPRDLNDSIPQAVEDVLIKALAKEADDRYAKAGDLAQALKEAAGALFSEPRSHPWQAATITAPVTSHPGVRPPSTGPILTAAQTAAKPAAQPPTQAPVSRRPARGWLVAAGIVILAVAAIVAFIGARNAQQTFGGVDTRGGDPAGQPTAIGPPGVAPTDSELATPTTETAPAIAPTEEIVPTAEPEATDEPAQPTAPAPRPTQAPPAPTRVPPTPPRPTATAASPPVVPMGSDGATTVPRTPILQSTRVPQPEVTVAPMGPSSSNDESIRPASSTPPQREAPGAVERPAAPQVLPMGAPTPQP